MNTSSKQEEILSTCLSNLIAKLEALGATIDIDTKMEVSGRIFYGQKLILINEPKAFGALLTMSHEGGHYLHYLRNPMLEVNRTRIFRERMAYLMGWHLLNQVGAVSSGIVTKRIWKENGIDPEFR